MLAIFGKRWSNALNPTNNLDSTKEKYLKVIEGKTAGLFSAASVLGGIITKQKQDTINDLTYLELFRYCISNFDMF